jgi:hypothetical protein
MADTTSDKVSYVRIRDADAVGAAPRTLRILWRDMSTTSVFADSDQVIRVIGVANERATNDQAALAGVIGLKLLGTEPRAVVAEMIEDEIAPAVWGEARVPATQRQRAFLAELDPSLATDLMSLRVADAWIRHLLLLRRAEVLTARRLQRGMQVVKTVHWTDPATGEGRDLMTKHEVSSIGSNGRVHFKGGNGQGAWPDELEVVNPAPDAASGT